MISVPPLEPLDAPPVQTRARGGTGSINLPLALEPVMRASCISPGSRQRRKFAHAD